MHKVLDYMGWIVAILAIGAVVFMMGCSSGSNYNVPIKSLKRVPRIGVKKPNPNYYLVLPSDTLLAIATRLKLNHHDIATYNGMEQPYTIYSGQRLRVTKPKYVVVKKPKPCQRPLTEGANRQKRLGEVPKIRLASRWLWPVRGKVPADFDGKGINIIAARGTTIKAVQAGTVVYAGNGLKGYGNLIILKHANNFLSAYAHNETLLVAEGAVVAQAQHIATMGSSAANKVMLHFEIRKNGKPVDPKRYLQ
ncbi:MAG: peptidase [Legionellales bacterium]|nr:MAG: peptidase [Legionellales bacterium]